MISDRNGVLSILFDSSAPNSGGVRTYLGDGRCVVWHPPEAIKHLQCAVDAERLDQPERSLRLFQWQKDDWDGFLTAWTQLEVMAKLTGVPILGLLKHRGMKTVRRYQWEMEEYGRIFMRKYSLILKRERLIVSLGFAFSTIKEEAE
jgi:hypothetical protein